MAAEMSKGINNNSIKTNENFNKIYNTETMVDQCLTKIASNYNSQDKKSNMNTEIRQQNNNVLSGFVRSKVDINNINNQPPKKKSRFGS